MSAVVILLLVALTVPPAASGAPPDAPPDDVEHCLACHADKDATATLASGEELRLYVDRDAFQQSVHGKKHGCLDCHPGMAALPHPALDVRTAREFRVAAYESCKRCHFEHYTRTLDSAHAAVLARGDLMAPTCVDCHGAHDIRPAAQPRTRVSTTCGKCHAGVEQQYVKSAHGAALAADGNPDVPVCTDCHKSHAIESTQTAGWRARTPQLCGDCHADAQRMAKYGLSTAVLETYLQDFHGVTASLDATRGDGGTVSALCTDCHGVHAIGKATGDGAKALRANLTQTCRSCHAQATDDFPDAWLSHWEPSWSHAPLVYAVNWAYWILIPFIIGGLALQILLHVWRVVVNR
jgi:predicted CXXCH cytochrome family protein